MSNLEFLHAKNALLTCSYNGLFLHSRFDPEKEALRFVESVSCSYIPSHVIITGACIGYVVPHLKKRWPEAHIIAVQYCQGFSDYDTSFDTTFTVTPDTTELTFSETLFSYLGEEPAFTSLFLSWTPSEKVWQYESSMVWKAIKLYMNKARDVIGTRNYFNKRWLKNTIKFFALTENHVGTPVQQKPIVICASGPTLQAALPVLAHYRHSYFLLCLSSALNALTNTNIIPDAVLSTDGGWWATQHLKPLITDTRLQNVPLWVTSESAVPAELLAKHPIQYISYGDPFELWLLSAIEGRTSTFYPLSGLRNGTVSGTALSLASALTTDMVYFCGLDLKSARGHQHTQPNCLEVQDSCTDCRTLPTETRITPKTFSSGSLSLYRNWFITRKIEQVSHCFRIISAPEQKGNLHLGHMRDITPEELAQKLSQTASVTVSSSGLYRQKSSTVPISQILSGLKTMKTDDPVLLSFMKSAALSEYLQSVRTAGSEGFTMAYAAAMAVLNDLITYAEKLQEHKRS